MNIFLLLTIIGYFSGGLFIAFLYASDYEFHVTAKNSKLKIFMGSLTMFFLYLPILLAAFIVIVSDELFK